MDDDLRALLGDDFDDEDDDDLFVEFDAADDDFFSDELFAEEDDSPASPVPPAQPADEWSDLPAAEESPEQEDDDIPAWLSDAPEPSSPAPAAGMAFAQDAPPEKAPKPKKKRSNRQFLGMTPFQRMVLSIFFFIDVLVIGFLLLVALGRVTF